MKIAMNKLLSFRLATIVTVFALAISSAQAQTLASYNFSNSNPTIESSNITADNAVWTIGGASFGGGDKAAYAKNTTLTTVFDSGEYLELTVNADSGYALDLNSFSFELGGSNNTLVDAISYAQVRSSVDGYSTSLTMTPGAVTEATVNNPAGGSFSASKTPFTISLSGSEYQELSSFTLRIYAYATGEENAFWKADNASFYGTVAAVPEPASVSLIIGLSGLGLAFWCRRRK